MSTSVYCDWVNFFLFVDTHVSEGKRIAPDLMSALNPFATPKITICSMTMHALHKVERKTKT